MFNMVAFFMMMLFARLYMRVGMLVACRKHFHDRIFPLKRDIWAHKASLISSLLVEVPVPWQNSAWTCICVLGINLSSFYNYFIWILNGFDSQVFSVSHFIFSFENKNLVVSDITTHNNINHSFVKTQSSNHRNNNDRSRWNYRFCITMGQVHNYGGIKSFKRSQPCPFHI